MDHFVLFTVCRETVSLYRPGTSLTKPVTRLAQHIRPSNTDDSAKSRLIRFASMSDAINVYTDIVLCT
ncbi:hypothetical protein DPMN_072088 [Dreissena polymorpha]|uniref:Uncharacterized protein n=1 Tax=Dreissena polymorpha TaxID=45954 RepID=A0A9D3Z3F4_DREPO|nr:hypothetical protein DPMN_072088 [Dreissena polymorpha]